MNPPRQPAQTAAAVEALAVLGKALHQIPPLLAEVCVDRFFRGSTIRDIADRHGISPSWARKTCTKSLFALRRALGRDGRLALYDLARAGDRRGPGGLGLPRNYTKEGDVRCGGY